MRTVEQKGVRKAFVNASRSHATAATFPQTWPPTRLDEREVVGWDDPKAPQRAYLLAEHDERLVALELRLTGAARSARATMCDLCHRSDADGGSRLVVARRAGARGRAGDTVGLYVCADFDCSLRAREELPAHQKSVSGLPDRRVEELRERLDAFVRRVLED